MLPIALTAWTATFGLVLIFFVVFPVIVQGLIAFAAAKAAGEAQENREWEERRAGRGLN